MQQLKSRFSRPFLATICAALALVAVGCGEAREKLIPVKAKVTFDGKPFGPLQLRFEPRAEKKKSVVGIADAEGNIAMTTYTVGDGAPPGDYSVIVASDPSGNAGKIPDIYQKDNNGLSAKIPDSGTAEFTIELKTEAGPISGAAGVQGAPSSGGAMDALRATDPAYKK